MTDSAADPLMVFDLDGTLVDTAGDLLDTLNVLMVREGLAALPYSAVGSLVGAGARAMIERGFSANGAGLAQGRVDALLGDFIQHYGANIAARSRPFPGVIAALDRLSAAGWRFAVCTNKLEGLSRRLLDELGLTPRFAAVCGGDTFAVRKPDPGHLLGTIDKAGGAACRTIMVGDSKADILAAQRAGIPVVAVTFGYTDEPVESFGPDRVIDHFDQLVDAAASLADRWRRPGCVAA
ncbi:phosphoglycolate phosphatase [Prosthecomicrobium sp. N25]|uniref:phosphoglycolate phosphatase n=1 Tax=Prosthecomicrobium sp. N25 TaxID=3129254 RepID=UPI0030782517